MAGLTLKQKAFCEEYLIDLNATQAAIRAGYSENTARSIASENLSKPDINDYIAELMNDRSSRTSITADRVLAEYAKLGFADVRNVVAWGDVPVVDGGEGGPQFPIEMIPSADVDDNTAAAISEVSLTAQGLKVKMHDKKGALDSIARHLGMFEDRIDHRSSDGTMSPMTAIKITSPKDE